MTPSRLVPPASLLLASLVLGGCSDDEPDVSPSTGEPASVQPAALDTPGGVPASDPDAAETGPADDAPNGAGAEEPGGLTGEPVLMMGVVSLTEIATLTGSTGQVAGSFVEFEAPQTPDLALATLLPDGDTCTVERHALDELDPSGGVPSAFDPFAATDPGTLRTVSAGDALVLTSPAGTWLTVERTELDEFVSYRSEGEAVVLPAPADLVVDVPGDDFPAFAAVEVPVVPSLENVSPDRFEAVTGDTVFRWDAGTDDAWRVAIDVIAVGNDPIEALGVHCQVEDDGEFRLSDAADVDFGDELAGVAVMLRAGVEIVQQGEALFAVTGASFDTTER